MVQLGNIPLISIVDDDQSVRTAMAEMVESFGYAVVTFASGSQFLASNNLHAVACLITDVRMPGMSGFDLHDKLTAATDDVPTIFLSAFPDEKGNDRAMKAGAVAYLSKPCRRNDLLAYIRSAVARGRGRGQ